MAGNDGNLTIDEVMALGNTHSKSIKKNKEMLSGKKKKKKKKILGPDVPNPTTNGLAGMEQRADKAIKENMDTRSFFKRLGGSR